MPLKSICVLLEKKLFPKFSFSSLCQVLKTEKMFEPIFLGAHTVQRVSIYLNAALSVTSSKLKFQQDEKMHVLG